MQLIWKLSLKCFLWKYCDSPLIQSQNTTRVPVKNRNTHHFKPKMLKTLLYLTSQLNEMALEQLHVYYKFIIIFFSGFKILHYQQFAKKLLVSEKPQHSKKSYWELFHKKYSLNANWNIEILFIFPRWCYDQQKQFFNEKKTEI